MKENKFLMDKEYRNFIITLKKNIIRARQIAIYKVNSELINLYYNIGKQIVLKQKNSNWGDDLIGQIEKDLKKEFLDIKGFSKRNLFYMKKIYLFFKNEKVPQPVAQIPWGHIRLILDKIKSVKEALFYIQETTNNNWSRVILEHQIELNLYERQGKILSNLETTTNEKEVNLISNSFKKDYILNFINLSKEAKAKDLEKELVNNITHFLMELGKGFAFVGKQHKLVVGDNEFFIDLLFYNYILKRFIVIELKTTEFKPEHLGQIGFYITAVNRDIKTDSDKETIGLLICKSKNKTVVEYALSNIKQPLGVAEYKLSQMPKDVIDCLPNENDLNKILEDTEEKEVKENE